MVMISSLAHEVHDMLLPIVLILLLMKLKLIKRLAIFTAFHIR